MTAGNVDLVKAIYSAFAAGDVGDVLAAMDPDITTADMAPGDLGQLPGVGSRAP